jgi:nitroreductase
MLYELVLKCRSVRRFYERSKVALSDLEELVDMSRLTASANNLQPLRYILSTDPAVNERIFPCLGWAASLADWPGPEPGERPTGYIVMLGDTEVSETYTWDQGIAAQTIMLGAVEKGLGGCIVGSINKDKLRSELEIDERYAILLVLAIGRPKEKILLEVAKDGSNVRYYRDANRVHHVPKRRLEDILLAKYK